MGGERFPSVIHLGAGSGVTGSCHLLQANGLNILVDCGAFQGSDAVAPMEGWPIKPSQVDDLLVTHAHVDHIGRIPELIQKGFRGQILTTHPTKELLIPMLEDAMGFSDIPKSEADRLSKSIEDLSRGFEYGEVFHLRNDLRFQLGRAGHILGSCFVRIEDRRTGRSVLFSGDLGARDTPLLPDPDPPDTCDLLILESTYGDTLHGSRHDRIRRLGAILDKAVSDGGKVFIPAFALGRVQELLYEIDRLFSEPDLQKDFPYLRKGKIPVLIDSPLGLRITKIYSRLSDAWDREAKELLLKGDHPIDFKELYAVTKHQDHNRILEMKGPAVIIAGSGMCTGGRILDHLKQGLDDPRNDVVFVGYQAEGTLGRKIMERSSSPGSTVAIEGERVAIRARVHAPTGYSAHGDQQGLVDWVASMPEKPGRIRLVHGDAGAKHALGVRLRELGYVVE